MNKIRMSVYRIGVTGLFCGADLIMTIWEFSKGFNFIGLICAAACIYSAFWIYNFMEFLEKDIKRLEEGLKNEKRRNEK